MEISFEPRFLLAAQEDPEQDARQQEVLSIAVAEAEACGFARAWVEPVFARSAPLDALRMCVASALRCERMRVVAGALDARSGSWIRLAEDAATADALLAGRLELGFASGAPDGAFLARMREGWLGGSLPLERKPNDEGEIPTFEIHPRPTRPDGPPLWAPIADEASACAAVACDLNAIVANLEIAAVYAAATRGAAGFQLALDAAGVPEPARVRLDDAARVLAPLRDASALDLALRVVIEVAVEEGPPIDALHALSST